MRYINIYYYYYYYYISNHNKMRPHGQNSKSLFIYISAVSDSMLLK